LYETISSQEREALCQLWKAIVMKDENKMKQYSVKLGVQGNQELLGPIFVHTLLRRTRAHCVNCWHYLIVSIYVSFIRCLSS
jgi:hypothetical protein